MLLYKATNTLNAKCYIGFTKGTLSKRKIGHYSKSAKGSKNHFHNALRKYSPEVFLWEILDTCETIEEAKILEKALIKKFDSYTNGYNSTLGGEGVLGHRHTTSSRARIGAANSKPKSADHRRKIADSLTGRSRGPMKEEARRKIAQAHIGMKRPQYTVTCPHCNKTGGNVPMKRWHFDQCKNAG